MLYNTPMMTFGTDQYDKALSFLKTQARPLELLRWNFLNGNATLDPILRALETFRNSDGGFGQALEPDMRSMGSSVLATLEALGIMAGLKVPPEEPLLSEALKWLTDTGGAYDAKRRLWPYLPPDIDESPRAPWWTFESLEDNFSGFLINPRARVLSYLYKWQVWNFGFMDESTAASILESTVTHAETLAEKVSPDTLRSLLILASAPYIPEELRLRIDAVVMRMIPESVETDPGKWSEYCLQPLEVAESPDSPWMDLLSDSVPGHLDYLIQNQNSDGSWSPFWNWGGPYPEAWQNASREWAGILTYRNLKLLSKFGRFSASDRL